VIDPTDDPTHFDDGQYLVFYVSPLIGIPKAL
jgi:hypothetical protein